MEKRILSEVKKMTELKDSGIEWLGLIPSHWKICKLKFIVRTNIETLSENTAEDYVLKYIDISSVEYEGGIKNFQEFEFLQAPSRARRILHEGDTIISTVRTYLKAIAYITKNFDGFIGSTGFSVLTPNKNIFNKFLYYATSSHQFISLVEADSVGISYPAITDFKLKNFKIPIPPLAGQKKIADFLDKKCSAIDSAVDAAKKLVAKLREYKKSLITETVTKGLNPSTEMQDSGVEWLGAIPSHWKKSNVFRCINFEGGSQPALTFFIDEPQKGYVRLIQNRDYKTDDYATYVPENMVTKFCDETDIMIGRYGPPIFVIHRGLKGAYNVAMMKATSFILDREFMYYFLQNLALLHYVESFSLRTAGQSGVNPAIFKKYPIFIPPLDEQKKIADFLDKKCVAIDENICRREKLIDKLTEYKKSLIYEVVTGKMEV